MFSSAVGDAMGWGGRGVSGVGCNCCFSQLRLTVARDELLTSKSMIRKEFGEITPFFLLLRPHGFEGTLLGVRFSVELVGEKVKHSASSLYVMLEMYVHKWHFNMVSVYFSAM